ncbi:MAG: DUF3999 family protein [Candidatus Acidiferrum sp.]
MKRRFLSFLLLLTAITTAAFAADLPPAWRSWHYSRSLASSHPDILNYAIIDRDAFAHSGNRLADLRIIDDLGNEQPFELRSRLAPPPQPVSIPATLRENSFVPGQFTQVVVDLGPRASFHNSLRVQTPESDFINWVEVAASDDAHLWRVVKLRAPISRFRRENLEGSQTIRYSENNARYLRLRIQESSQQFPVTSVEVFASQGVEKEEPSPAPLIALLPPDPAGAPSQTQWTVDLQSASIPVAELNFETDQPEFYRAVRILTSADSNQWQPAGGGEIYRYSVAGKTEESLRVSSYELGGSRFWRVEILNGNDVPLSSVRLSLAMSRRIALFRPRESRSYRLIYGNARAIAPQYDFSRTLRIRPNEVLSRLDLGPEETTANYADPRPFTERHPNLLWIALGLAIVLLGYAALRAMRTSDSAAQ